MRIFTTLDEVAAAVGEELGTSDWLTIDQERVDAFADATDDHQWIHVDVERAEDGPFGGTIAHGYLTLSLLPCLGSQVFRLRDARRQAQLRRSTRSASPRPVPVGSRIRAPRHGRRASPTVPAGKQVTFELRPSRSRARPSPPASPRPSSCCCADGFRPIRSITTGVGSYGDAAATVGATS